MDRFSLEHLLRPVDAESFLRDVWDRSSCVCRQSLAGMEAEILSLSGLELILATLNRAHEGWLQLARGGRRAVPPQMVDKDGMLDLRQLHAAFGSGDTIYLTKAERLSPSLMQLCRAVELDLVARGMGLRRSVNAHVFLTPPESQGFPPHRDEHASFVLQLEGTKEWMVYEPAADAPGAQDDLQRPGLVDPRSLSAMNATSYRLEAGDLLYIPEAWPHEAKTSRSHSLHVTLRVFSLRWVDVMLELCNEHPGLIGAVPRHAVGAPQGLATHLADVLGSPRFQQPLAGLLARVARRHVVPETVLPDDGFRQVLDLGRIELDTLLERRAGVSCHVFDDGDAVCIGFPGGVVRGPALIRNVFEYVARVPVLRPSDLPALANRAKYDRLDVARTLVRDGVLRISDRRGEHEPGASSSNDSPGSTAPDQRR